MPAPRHRLTFAWSLLAGTCLCVISGFPGAGALLAFLHAGSDSVVTGLWLRRTDPVRRRATTCWLFYLATACWKGAAAAFLTVLLFVVVLNSADEVPRFEDFAPTVAAVVGGIIGSTLVGAVAMCAALKHGVRVWIHPRLRQWLHRDPLDLSLPSSVPATRSEWKTKRNTLQNRSACGVNHAIFVVATTLFLPYLAGTTWLLISVIGAADANEQPTTGWILLAALVAGPLGLLPVYAWLSSRIIALTPIECWQSDLPVLQSHDS